MMRDDFEQMCLIYIESEIINYRWHQAQIEHYRDMADKIRQQYAEELACPRTGGSIIRMPEGVGQHTPWQIELSGRIYELEERAEAEKKYIDQVDRWIAGVCTPAQETMVRCYMIDQQCRDVDRAADRTGYSPVNVKRPGRGWSGRFIRDFSVNCILGDTFKVLS